MSTYTTIKDNIVTIKTPISFGIMGGTLEPKFVVNKNNVYVFDLSVTRDRMILQTWIDKVTDGWIEEREKPRQVVVCAHEQETEIEHNPRGFTKYRCDACGRVREVDSSG